MTYSGDAYLRALLLIIPRIMNGLPAPSARMLQFIVDAGAVSYFRASHKFRAACIQAAWTAHLAHRKSEALVKWELVMKEWPEQCVGYCGVAAMARETGKLDYAARVIDEALRRFPDDAAVVSSAARISGDKRDWKTSVALWERVVNAADAPPDWRPSYANALRNLGRHRESQEALRDGAPRANPVSGANFDETLPSFDAAVEAAWRDHLAAHKVEALKKWEFVARKWPNEPVGYCGVATLARETGDLPYAMEVIDKALVRFPDDAAVISLAAQIASYRGDWAASVGYWERIIDGTHEQLDWYHAYAMGLLTLGRFERLDPLLKSLRQRFPDYNGFLQVQAMQAEALQNYDESLALWREFRGRFPDDPVGWEHYGRVHQARELARIDGVTQVEASGGSNIIVLNTPVDIEVVEDEEARVLLSSFESLGFNCELGLVQRRFGAEPLSLLRFNSVSLDGLLAALANRFLDMGKPETTELECASNGEYYLKDRRWGLGMHTFIFKGQQDSDVLFKKFCRRSAFLKDKLLADLTDARKIFVYSSPRLSRDELMALHRALLAVGPVTLLHIRLSSSPPEGFPEASPGAAMEISEGLFVGYLRRPGNSPDGSWDIAFDDWVSICRKVYDAVAARKTSAVERQAS